MEKNQLKEIKFHEKKKLEKVGDLEVRNYQI